MPNLQFIPEGETVGSGDWIGVESRSHLMSLVKSELIRRGHPDVAVDLLLAPRGLTPVVEITIKDLGLVALMDGRLK